jgi:glycosyltransferase involved in cell wall biosynthesis
MRMPDRPPDRPDTSGLRLAIVTTHPPGKGSLNEYGYHFVRFLRHKPEVAEVILLVDRLPDGEVYEFEDHPHWAPVHVIPCWDFGRSDNALRIRSAVQKMRPDGVLFNIQFASFGSGKVPASLGLLTPALLTRMGCPTIVLLHNIMETVDLRSAGFAPNPLVETLIRQSGTFVMRQLLAADLVALTIPKYVEIVRAKYGATNVVLAPHGAFEEGDQDAVAQSAAPATGPCWELPPGPQQIMTFGKFGTYKKLETLVEAFKLLQARAVPQATPIELVIAGTDSPNAAGYLQSVRARCADVQGIRFTGYVAEEDVPHIFGDAAVVVFPYTSTTGSSGVLHQAGDYGKAVVLPHIGDFAEVIAEEGYAGEFFAPGDAQSLAAAIARVIDDPIRRQRLGAQNYAASRGLPIAEVVDWYLLHFQMLIEQKQRQGLVGAGAV